MDAKRQAGPDDAQLVARIANGDRQALEILYTRHHKKVFHFIRRFVDEPAMAEDLANDVFIEVWQSASRFEGRSQASSWVLGIARFKALSERRKQKDTVDPDDALGGMEDDADTPEMTAQKLSKGDALKRCIAGLSEDHRAIIDLVYYHEKSIRECADILQIPENTVKTRMFHARNKLSALMEQAGLDRGWP